MRTVEFLKWDVDNLVCYGIGVLSKRGFDLHHTEDWKWDDVGRIKRLVVIRHVETGILYSATLNMALIDIDEYEAGSDSQSDMVTFREVRETKIEVPHFEYAQ